jgi:hypothetical protein
MITSWPCRADAGLIGVSQISQITTSQDFAGSDFERGKPLHFVGVRVDF